MEKDEFLAWQHDLEVSDKGPTQAQPTVFRHNNFVAILDLPEGEHQYKFFVDGQWTHDPSEPVVTSQLGTVNNIIQVKKTDFEVFDALMVDSQKCSEVSALLPEPNHVMLNHLYALSIKDGVMVLSATHRYKKKYVTTLLYKPI
ncbi:hypothetical protein Chor_013026 [Crotalus horridus]